MSPSISGAWMDFQTQYYWIPQFWQTRFGWSWFRMRNRELPMWKSEDAILKVCGNDNAEFGKNNNFSILPYTFRE